MGLEDLCKVLDKIETEERYEEKEIKGVPILEAVSDYQEMETHSRRFRNGRSEVHEVIGNSEKGWIG